jgi:hypothetical protein
MTFIMQEEIPEVANIFIDDLPIKGLTTQYLDKEGQPETLPEKSGIRRSLYGNMHKMFTESCIASNVQELLSLQRRLRFADKK